MRSFPAVFLFLALIPGTSVAASAELVQRVGDFYQRSECAGKTSKFSGESVEAVTNSLREILRVNNKKSNEEAIYDLLETVSGSNFSLDMHCLPPLKAIAPYDRWLQLLSDKKIKSLGEEGSPASLLAAELSANLSAEKDPALAAVKQQLMDVLEPMYAEFKVRQSLIRIFRVLSDDEGEGRALLLASRLGDTRAYAAAENAVNMFLSGNYDDSEGYHRAVLALEAFSGQDPAIISSRQVLLKKVSASPMTPEITRQAVEKSSSAK